MVRLRRTKLLAAGLLSVAVIAGACGSSGSSSSPGTSKAPSTTASNSGAFTPVGTKTTGGTVTWAESPGATPNYIFPFYNFTYCSVANASQFQPLMYRSLYWYGNNNQAQVDYDYSIGNAPVFSADGKTVTVTLKSTYKWSDGESVDARDVVFWMNLLEANKANWCDYTPGYFPDNLASFSATGPYTVQFVFKKAYNPSWVIYNELSQVTPIPLAWDTTTSALGPTADSPNLPDLTPAGATKVYNNLAALAKNTASYATNPIWAVEDGPFKLTNFTSTGEADFVPNPAYTGPVKPTIAEFKELPFTSQASEVNQIRQGPSSLSIGYLPVDQVPQLGAITSLGYKALEDYTFSFSYFPMNLENPKFGKVFSQQYFRQAFQDVVDQQGWINAFEKGNAIPTYGPVPTNPTNPFQPPDATTNPYPYSTSAAAQLLSSHGWKVVPNGTTTCVSPGSGPTNCGAGIPAGLGLSFNLDYESQVTYLDSEMKDLKSDASLVGIQLQLTTHPFNTVIGTAVPCTPNQAACSWTMENWGAGWVYSPDFYPSGESILATGSAANAGSYSSPEMDSLIQGTTTASAATAQSVLNSYQDYVRQQVPVIMQPNTDGNPQPGGPTVVSNHLGGFTANAYSYITPELYYLTN